MKKSSSEQRGLTTLFIWTILDHFGPAHLPAVPWPVLILPHNRKLVLTLEAGWPRFGSVTLCLSSGNFSGSFARGRCTWGRSEILHFGQSIAVAYACPLGE